MPGKWKKIKRTSLALFLAAIITFGVVGDTTKVFAQEAEPTFDSQFFSGNDIQFYDPTYQAVCAPGGGQLVGDTTKEKIWNFLIANNLSPEQAAGLMGNMQKESNFIPIRYQNDENFDPFAGGGHKGWGLVQWDSGRRVDIVNTIKDDLPHLEKYIDFKYNGIPEPNEEFPAKDFDEMLLFQLDYMFQESSEARGVTAHNFPGSADNEWERMKEQPTLRDATLFWERNFEVSGDWPDQSKLQLRIDEAQKVFDEFKDNISATGSGTASCAHVSGLQELTLQYAWPERKRPSDDPNDAATPTDTYEQAINSLPDSHYVGGCVTVRGETYCGIDCGAFVTRLVIDSGYDPEYNYGGDRSDGAGNTADQERWLDDNWEPIGRAGSFDVAELRAGDVAMVTSEDRNHTFIYVGEISGFGGNGSTLGVASASIGRGAPSSGGSWRAPMAGGESLSDSDFTWYRRE